MTRRECYQSCRLAALSSFDEKRQEEVGEEEVAKIVGAKLVFKALQECLNSSVAGNYVLQLFYGLFLYFNSKARPLKSPSLVQT